MIKIRLKKLRDQFKKHNLDGYVVPKNDEFLEGGEVKCLVPPVPPDHPKHIQFNKINNR